MEIPEIKTLLKLPEVLKHYGLKPDKNHRLHCPFHEDKTPSLQVYYKTQTCYCFSSNCKAHGKSLDVIDFIMHKENISKAESINKAKEMVTGKKEERQETKDMVHSAILTKMFSYFKNAVHNSKPARDYIEKRGLDYNKLEIGYNTGQFHHGERKEEALIKSCQEIGLLHPFGNNTRTGGQAYKPFAKYSIVFALKNKSNQITGLYFRSTINEENAKHYYLKDRSGLYPCYPNPNTEKLILTESIIDCASFLQNTEITKEYALLASYGTNGLTEEHKIAIKELKQLKEIIFAFDNDEAGRAATEKYASELKSSYTNLRISSLELPCKDVNETLIAHEPAIFIHLLDKRVFLEEKKEEREKKKENQKEIKSENILDIKNPYKLIFKTETANYYIQGGISKMLDSMKVTLIIEGKENKYKTRNKLDLYEDKLVEKTCRVVSEKMDIRKDLLESDIYKLTNLLDDYRENELLKETKTEEEENPFSPLSTKEKEQIETFAKKPNLIKNLNDLLGKTGIVGEEKNRIFLLIIAASYKMPETLHALIQGSSGSGKTRLLKQISDCIPKEKVTRLTRVSDKVLYNYPEKYFVNRLFCLEDIDGLSEEAEFAFRELQSNGELNSATSIKLENGQIVAGQKTVKGPIASLACTTRGEIYEDNMSRVFLIAIDESPQQTKRIIEYQNKKAAGEIEAIKEIEVKNFIQKFIRELTAYQVVNPYAGKIHLPEEAQKIRRLNDLFQGFVKMITVFNQYQRKKDAKNRLITQIEDIETAVEIMFESIVLKVDELDGSLRQFYENLKSYLKKNYNGSSGKAEFSLIEIRQNLKISKTQLFRYVNDLLELEYLHQSGGFANRGFKYKINYWDNYQIIREKIKNHLSNQLKELTNGTPRNTNGTPEKS